MIPDIIYQAEIINSVRCSDSPKFLLVLLHGYGQAGRHMMRDFSAPFSEEIDDTIFYALSANGACKEFPNGFDWLRYDKGEWTREVARQRLAEESDSLADFIHHLNLLYHYSIL